jgi:uncharacterized protein YqgV (UPF0045/DUF77 family)
MISCQISYIPLGTEAINEQVDEVLLIIERSGLIYEIGGMATTLTGEKEAIIRLINNILGYAARETTFILDVRLSNQCGLE